MIETKFREGLGWKDNEGWKMRLEKLLIAMLAIVPVLSANAGSLSCSGTVAEISYHANDKLMIRLSSMNTIVSFCNPSATWTVAGTSYTTSAETCKAIYSAFLSAKASGTTVTGMYMDGADVPADCNSFPAWASVNIRHFRF